MLERDLRAVAVARYGLAQTVTNAVELEVPVPAASFQEVLPLFGYDDVTAGVEAGTRNTKPTRLSNSASIA